MEKEFCKTLIILGRFWTSIVFLDTSDDNTFQEEFFMFYLSNTGILSGRIFNFCFFSVRVVSMLMRLLIFKLLEILWTIVRGCRWFKCFFLHFAPNYSSNQTLSTEFSIRRCFGRIATAFWVEKLFLSTFNTTLGVK